MRDLHRNQRDGTDSVYWEELRRGPSSRFHEALEASYIQTHLERVRLRARAWFSLSGGIAAAFAFRDAQVSGFASPTALIHFCVLLPCDIAMIGLVWSSLYSRYFVRIAPYLVTATCAIAAGSVAIGLSAGRDAELSALTTTVIAIYSFSGLMFRQTWVPVGGVLIAFLTAASLSGAPAASLTEAAMALGCTVALCLVVSRDNEWAHRKSFLEDAIIRELADRDGLSGLMNRRSFDEHLLRVWQQGLRDQRKIAVLMIDIDHFKRYNDTYGHVAGDAAIRAVAQVVRDIARRPLDLAARYGGEEFAVILYDLAPTHARDVAERLRLGVRQLRMDVLSDMPSLRDSHVTVSVGLGMGVPTLGRTPQGIVQLADEALYKAKAAGRDQVILHGVEEYESLETGIFRAAR